jgi:predicted oxidoreductase (fatty acid repression mutant protein)
MSPSTSNAFIEAIKSRRTYYALKNTSPIPDSKIQEIINDVVLHVPSAFNSQTTRVVLLLKGEHEKLWDITRDVLKEIVPAENFAPTEQRMAGFRAAYGSVSSVPVSYSLFLR